MAVKKKSKKSEGKISEKELKKELDDIEEKFEGANEAEKEITIKASKPISKIKKGDKVKVDGVEYEVDNHYVLMNHPSNNEMAIEVFNPKTDADYQIRYFDDQAERTIGFYELQGEIMFVKKLIKKIEW